MKTSNIQKIKLLFVAAVLSIGISAGIANKEEGPCPKSKWMIEARIVDPKQKTNNAEVVFTFINPEFGIGVQTIDLTYGKTKRQIKSDVKGNFRLNLKPGKVAFTIAQYKCATLKQSVEIKNRERISIKVTFAAQDPAVKCG
ncbi:MAG: hypothetical protein ACHQF2_07660 [Flavobacteriales bacterium]